MKNKRKLSNIGVDTVCEWCKRKYIFHFNIEFLVIKVTNMVFSFKFHAGLCKYHKLYYKLKKKTST